MGSNPTPAACCGSFTSADALIKVSGHGHLRGGVGQPRARARRPGARSSAAADRVKRELVPIGVGRRVHPGAGRSSPAGRDPTGRHGKRVRRQRHGLCVAPPSRWLQRARGLPPEPCSTERKAEDKEGCTRWHPKAGGWPAGVAAHGFDREKCSTAPGRSYKGSRKATFSNAESLCVEGRRPLCHQSKQRSELAADPLRDLLQHRFHPRRRASARDLDAANRTAGDAPRLRAGKYRWTIRPGYGNPRLRKVPGRTFYGPSSHEECW